MNLYQYIKKSEHYLAQLEKNPPQNTKLISHARKLHTNLKEAGELYPKLGLDALYIQSPYNSSVENVNIYYRKLFKAYEILEKVQQSRFSTWHFFSYKDTFDPRLLRSAIKKDLNRIVLIQERWEFKLNSEKNFLNQYSSNIWFLMSQVLMPAFGSSDGECYGLVRNYALHLEKKSKDVFSFNLSASELQEFQNIKNYQVKEEATMRLYPRRLGIVTYQPNLSLQAEAIAAYGNQFPNTHLSISLSCSIGHHAVYLRKMGNNWHFFDSNHGAFNFGSELEFKTFYNRH